MCSMLPYGTGICCYTFLQYFNFYLLLLSILFLCLKKLVLINWRNGLWYLCAFFNRGNTEGINSSNILMFDVCVCFVLVGTDFVDVREFVIWWLVYGAARRQIEVCFVVWPGSNYQLTTHFMFIMCTLILPNIGVGCVRMFVLLSTGRDYSCCIYSITYMYIHVDAC